LPYQICVAKKKKWLHYLCAFSKCSWEFLFKENDDDIKKHNL
jgi:hypothetical protein